METVKQTSKPFNVNDLKKYVFEAKLTKTKRAAHFFDWAAGMWPGQFIPYNYVVKAINGYGHTPRVDNEEVEALRHNMGGVRHTLQTLYGRTLETLAGQGARATVDSLDVVKHAVPKNIHRLNGASAALAKTAALVDARQLPAAGPDAHWRDWFSKTVSPAVKALADDARIAKLLPPAKKDGE